MAKTLTPVPTVPELLEALEAKGTEAFRKSYLKGGATGRVLGVKMGDLRALAKPLKTQHALALELWASGCFEAQVLAVALLDPKRVDADQAAALVTSACGLPALDKLTDLALPNSPGAAALREAWAASEEAWWGRAGWNLWIAAAKEGPRSQVDWARVLGRIEVELPDAPRPKKEAMNECLVMIGVHHPALTEAALAVGERLGRWDDRPVPKGCVSSYPPEWIPAAIRLRRRGPKA